MNKLERVVLGNEGLVHGERPGKLDVWVGDEEGYDLSDELTAVERYYQVMGQAMRPDGKPNMRQRELASTVEIFINEKEGTVNELVMIPSEITKEVGWTFAENSIKLGEQVGEWKGLTQEERKRRWIELVAQVEAVYLFDHGYGAGAPAIDAVTSEVMKGKLKDPVSEQPIELTEKEMLVKLTTKGMGGTYLEEKERMGRQNKPKYRMEATYLQMMEAFMKLNTKTHIELLSYYASEHKVEELMELKSDFILNKECGQTKQLAGELVKLAELFGGTFLSNRTVALDGNSMAGYEVMKAYFGQVMGRFSPEVSMYWEQLFAAYQSQMRRLGQGTAGVRIAWYEAGREGGDWLTKRVNGLQTGWAEKLAELRNIAGNKAAFELAEIRMSRFGNVERNITMKDVVREQFWNAIFEAETPVVRGKKNGRELSRLKGEHVLIGTVRNAWGLRLLISFEKLGPRWGKFAYMAGEMINQVWRELCKFVPDSALGVNKIRATHLVGLDKFLASVEMDDGALMNAGWVAGKETEQQFRVRETAIVTSEGEERVSTLSVYGTEDDQVLREKDMRERVLAMCDGNKIEFEKVYTLIRSERSLEDAIAGHYLPRRGKELIWRRMKGRSEAVQLHREEILNRLVINLM